MKKVILITLFFFNISFLKAQFIEDEYAKPDTLLQKQNFDLQNSQKKEVPVEKKKYSEEVKEKKILDKLFVGGNFAFQIGRNYSAVNLSPLIGIKAHEKLALGFQGVYQFGKNNITANNVNYKVFGGRLFAEYLISKNIYPHIEYEYLEYSDNDNNNISISNIFSAFLAGASINLAAAKNFSFQTLLLYNLLWSEDQQSIYTSPFVFRFGVRYNF